MNNETCTVCKENIPYQSVIDEKTICYDCLLKEQQEKMANLSNDDVSHVAGFFALTDKQRKLLLNVYKKHLKAMGKVSRQRFLPNNLKRVEWDKQEKTVNIYFENDWWHYQKNGSWY